MTPQAGILDRLNENLLLALQRSGRVYMSNARLNGRFALRACLINFRTTRTHVERNRPSKGRARQQGGASRRQQAQLPKTSEAGHSGTQQTTAGKV